MLKTKKFMLIVAQGLIISPFQCKHQCIPAAQTFIRTSRRNNHSQSMVLKKSLKDWSFTDSKLSSLPLDPEVENFIRRSVPKSIFSVVRPTPYKSKAKLVAASNHVLRDLLDMDPSITDEEDFVNWAAGNTVLDESTPMAHRYGGYQFGHWADQLGDGRAHLLGEYVNSKGERYELQLKGSGKTPYSRFGDGRAVLRSSVREFLCSEAMHHLGIPTSRAATLIVTDDPIPRDMFYDGRLKMERGAVVLRLAPSWFRFGSFEILSMNGEIDELRQLADFVLSNSFPHIAESGEDGYLAMFSEVCENTAKMIAKWSTVGFTHGVMNTDNMSIGSVTIDYGPFGFLDEYNPNFIPNHSDDMGRYDFENQVQIGLWNLNKLSIALKPILSTEKHAQLEVILQGYGVHYQKTQLELYRRKLGLVENGEKGKEGLASDELLLGLLLDTMEKIKADYTQTFRDLSELSLEDIVAHRIPDSAWGLTACFKSKQIKEFITLYAERLRSEGRPEDERLTEMQAINPRYILRNWIAQRAIEMAEQDDFSEVQFLLQIFENPYRINREAEARGYGGPPPSWSKKLSVSCSS